MSKNKIKDQSQDREYFIMTPQFVLDMCETPQEYTLWCVIKMVAGDSGECYLSTPQLATMAMMSTGACSVARKGLFNKKLIEGGFKKDKGYTNPVLHITIPDLWEANIKWRKDNPSLISRIEKKEAQRSALQDQRKQARDDKASQSESLQYMKPSYIETEPSYIEGRGSYIETKKNQSKKNQIKEEHINTPPNSKSKTQALPPIDDGSDLATKVGNKHKFVTAFSSALRMPSPIERREIETVGVEPGACIGTWKQAIVECGIYSAQNKITVGRIVEVYRLGGTWAALVAKWNKEAEAKQAAVENSNTPKLTPEQLQRIAEIEAMA